MHCCALVRMLHVFFVEGRHVGIGPWELGQCLCQPRTARSLSERHASTSVGLSSVGAPNVGKHPCLVHTCFRNDTAKTDWLTRAGAQTSIQQLLVPSLTCRPQNRSCVPHALLSGHGSSTKRGGMTKDREPPTKFIRFEIIASGFRAPF